MDTRLRFKETGLKDAVASAGLMLAITAATILLLGDSYLLFHTFTELFTSAIGLMIFSVAWHTRKITTSDYVTFLGIAAFPVAMITILHTLSYKGMPVFPDQTANLPTTLWVIARALQASSFLLAPVFIVRKLKSAGTALSIYVIAGSALVSLAFAGALPMMFVDGSGLTPFKVWSEYAVIAVTVLGAMLLFRFRNSLERRVFVLLTLSMSATVFAELAFTLYTDVTGLFNRLGHAAHLVAFVLLYIALVSTSLEQPLTGLFLKLNRQREELSAAYEIEHDIAETLQEAMSIQVRDVPGLEVSHRYIPSPGKGHIGGDFYDVFLLEEDKVAFSMGDVCGKGLRAAADTVRARSAIRALAFREPEPAALLESVNRYLYDELDSDCFVTALFGVVHTRSGHVEIAIAGHPDPVICGRVHERPPAGIRSQPLGVLPELGAGTWRFRMSPEEVLVAVTDGAIEAPGAQDRFGTERLEALLEATGCKVDAESVVESVVDALLRHTAAKIDDDVAIMAIRYVPDSREVALQS